MSGPVVLWQEPQLKQQPLEADGHPVDPAAASAEISAAVAVEASAVWPRDPAFWLGFVWL